MIDATKWPKEALDEHNRLCGVLDGLKAEIRQLQGLVSRHAEGCPHHVPGGRDVFCLNDEDSYDVCTCLRNFVSTTKLEPYRETRAVLLELAPFVAVFARNMMVSPETREMLLKLEPRMLAALIATKET